ncbi:amidase [Colwellia echini]|uniref:Amidase n=1 Tax=Colwellia echini TaxID=1982103 RepID=A0ABY3MZJ5_9GAMM|nr:amidase [Colwellia echini]TYK66632.1 amidase [Colwellia echini]
MNNNINQYPAIFCAHGPKNWQTTKQGALAGLRLGVKDLFAVAGEKNSAGNPDWFAQAAKATTTASAIDKLMAQGCQFVGFTHTDEIAYSLEGNNIHYGVAENPKVKGHACGGSSMGSAAAVAANLVDIGLGTDTGGSVRIPASYCGLFGIRPSHGVIAKDGLIPLAKDFDTIGWLTNSASLLQEVGDVLLPAQTVNQVNTLLVCEPLFDLVATELQPLLEQSLTQAKQHFSHCRSFNLANTEIISELADAFRILQGRNIAQQHGQWISAQNPIFSAAVAGRFTMAMSLTEQEEREALKVQKAWQKIMADNLNTSTCLFLPTTPTTAPKIGADTSTLRMQILTLSAIAGLSRSAQVHLPFSQSAQGHPYGFSLLMSQGNDKSLLETCQNLAASADTTI